MTDRTYLYDGTHVLIAGVTGSGNQWGGKTATANWWADCLVERGHYDFMVAFDQKGGNYVGERVDGPQAAAQAVQEGHRRLDWSPDGWGDFGEQHVDMVRFADGLNGSVVLVHDDAVMYADSDSLKYATALGGNPGDGGDAMKSLVVSQDPWDLPRKGVRSNLPVMAWVGPTTEEAESYFRGMKKGSAFETIRERHTRPHMWSVVDGDRVDTFDPVPEEYA